MKRILATAVLGALAPAAFAQASIDAGRAKAEQVCAACHGANGISVTDNIPNLAGQRATYIENQLKAYKDGTRKAPNAAHPAAIMTAMASMLSPAEMTNVAAYFASLPGAAAGAKSPQMAGAAKTNLGFPTDFKASFVKYHTINFPATRQVRHYYANPPAVAAARAGKPMPEGAYLLAEVYAAKLDASGKPLVGADGFFIADKPMFYTAMGTNPGWGDGIPEALRNANWNYGVFALDGKPRPMNHAECLGCHKPLDATSYLFTLKELSAVK